MIDPILELTKLNYPFEDMGDWLKMKCPDPNHNDSNPSCGMRKNDGVWNCFSCSAKGNLFTFAKLLGVKLDKTSYNMLNSAYQKTLTFDKLNKKNKLETTKIVWRKGQQKSPLHDSSIRNFLWSIGIYKDEFIEERNIKYCYYGEAIGEHLIGTEQEKWTKFVKRILFPIYNSSNGNLVSLEGRTFVNGGKPKVLYPKGGTTRLLYNYDFCDLKKDIILVEGIKDLCKVWNVNSNVVSSFRGILTDEQINQLSKCKGKIIMFIDNDEAGWKALKDLSGRLLDKDLYFCYSNKAGNDPNDCTLYEIEKLIDNAEYYLDDLYEEIFKIE